MEGFMIKKPDKEVIVEIGADGGSIALFGVHSPRGWLYSRSVGELIDEERSQHDSNVVGSWKAALGLLDQYLGTCSIRYTSIRNFDDKS
jgi:hypothetical protein